MSTTAELQRVDPVLSTKGLSYSYPSGLHVLDGVNLDLMLGEVVSIVGPSGCGKSTMLSLIAELARPSGGSIEWNKKHFAPADEVGRRQLAMMFQRDTVFPWQTVEKNLQFGMVCSGVPQAEREARTEELLRLGKLTEFRKSYPGALSGGMRRRLALLVALSVRPGVLLLDEPFSALDEPTRIDLHADVLKLVYESGVSVILVTHDLGEAITISDRVIVMTRRPSNIKTIVDVGFGHDRDIMTIRESAEYGELYARLWHELWSEIRAQQ